MNRKIEPMPTAEQVALVVPSAEKLRAVFDIDRLQGELEFKLPTALRHIADAIDAGQLDVGLVGFVPSADPKYHGDTRAHVLVKLHLAAEIRKNLNEPSRNPARTPCSDCWDGRCTMNCGPAIPRKATEGV